MKAQSVTLSQAGESPFVGWFLQAVDCPRSHEPRGAYSNHHNRKPPTIKTVRREFFRGGVQRVAVGQDTRFGKLVKGEDRDLRHKQEQENAGHLEESFDVYQVSEMPPCPGHRRRSSQSDQGTRNQSRTAYLQKHQGRFHSFAAA